MRPIRCGFCSAFCWRFTSPVPRSCSRSTKRSKCLPGGDARKPTNSVELETHKSKLLQIISTGQPELEAVLARHSLRQLAQRIAVRARIKPLGFRQSCRYILHRTRCAADPRAPAAVHGSRAALSRLCCSRCTANHQHLLRQRSHQWLWPCREAHYARHRARVLPQHEISIAIAPRGGSGDRRHASGCLTRLSGSALFRYLHTARASPTQALSADRQRPAQTAAAASPADAPQPVAAPDTQQTTAPTTDASESPTPLLHPPRPPCRRMPRRSPRRRPRHLWRRRPVQRAHLPVRLPRRPPASVRTMRKRQHLRDHGG